jgi:hypothetical protein
MGAIVAGRGDEVAGGEGLIMSFIISLGPHSGWWRRQHGHRRNCSGISARRRTFNGRIAFRVMGKCASAAQQAEDRPTHNPSIRQASENKNEHANHDIDGNAPCSLDARSSSVNRTQSVSPAVELRYGSSG